jgi:hypothetical protein
MSDAESFLKLAKELRSMGATSVSGYGFTAVFPANLAPRAESAKAPPAKGRPKELPKDPEALRELQYARELGKA